MGVASNATPIYGTGTSGILPTTSGYSTAIPNAASSTSSNPLATASGMLSNTSGLPMTTVGNPNSSANLVYQQYATSGLGLLPNLNTVQSFMTQMFGAGPYASYPTQPSDLSGTWSVLQQLPNQSNVYLSISPLQNILNPTVQSLGTAVSQLSSTGSASSPVTDDVVTAMGANVLYGYLSLVQPANYLIYTPFPSSSLSNLGSHARRGRRTLPGRQHHLHGHPPLRRTATVVPSRLHVPHEHRDLQRPAHQWWKCCALLRPGKPRGFREPTGGHARLPPESDEFGARQQHLAEPPREHVFQPDPVWVNLDPQFPCTGSTTSSMPSIQAQLSAANLPAASPLSSSLASNPMLLANPASGVARYGSGGNREGDPSGFTEGRGLHGSHGGGSQGGSHGDGGSHASRCARNYDSRCSCPDCHFYRVAHRH